MSFILQYKTMIKEAVDQVDDTTVEVREKAKVIANRLPLKIMIMIIQYDVKNVWKNLKEMISNHKVSVTLLHEVYNYFEKNSTAVNTLNTGM